VQEVVYCFATVTQSSIPLYHDNRYLEELTGTRRLCCKRFQK